MTVAAKGAALRNRRKVAFAERRWRGGELRGPGAEAGPLDVVRCVMGVDVEFYLPEVRYFVEGSVCLGPE